MKKTINIHNILFLLLTLSIPTLPLKFLTSAEAQSADSAASIVEAKRDAQSLSRAFEYVASAVTPSLVNIKASTKIKKTNNNIPNLPPNMPDAFREFFERFGESMPNSPYDNTPRRGMGSGVLIDANGHILTNNHVIEGADEVVVQLNDGRAVDAKIIGSDPRTDLAVIKIEADNIKPAKLGDSDNLKIGEWVVAAGAPFGLDNTITAGIVSAKGRSIMGGSAYEDFIQTDAAINPGNSGGPLANLDGEVIGINTAIFSRTGGYMGIGFAIPINLAKTVMKSLIEEGKVTRGWLGVVIQELTEDLAKTFNYPSTKGALVAEVGEGSPAEKSGIVQGDILVALNGRKINEVNDLRNMVAAEKPGTRVTIEYIRQGRSETTTVKLDELPANLDNMQNPLTAPEEPTSSILGLRLEKLTPEIKNQIRARTSNGLLVKTVEPDSPAAKANIQAGDIIHTVGSKKINSISDLEKAIDAGSLKTGIRMIVETRGMDRFVVVRE